MLDLEQYAAANREDYLGQHWFSSLVQRLVDLLLFRKVVSRLWIPLRMKGRYVTVTQYESLRAGYGECANRRTVIKIGPLYFDLTDDRGSHDAIVYAAVNKAIEEEMSAEKFHAQRLRDGKSGFEALQAVEEDHPYTEELITDFAMSLLEQQHSQEAEDLLWWAWVGKEGEPGAMDADDPGDFMSIFLLGVQYMHHAHYELAEKLLTQASEGCEATCGAEDPLMIDILNTFVQLYESWDKPNEVTKWRSKLRQTEGTVK